MPSMLAKRFKFFDPSPQYICVQMGSLGSGEFHLYRHFASNVIDGKAAKISSADPHVLTDISTKFEETPPTLFLRYSIHKHAS